MPPKKKQMRLRLKARIASKVREKDLLEKAKALMDDYELILPECAEDCGSCPFRKTRARLEKISRFKDNPRMLARFARSGDRLARAYAATIGLVHEEKTPYLATATYPAGTITFVLRGKTNREKLISVQNYDSPKWRVLGVLDLVKKKSLHFYSYGDNFICTGKYSRPPEDYVEEAAESVGATRSEGDTYSCPHDPASQNHLEFDWTTAGKKILLCDQCAGKAKNTLAKLGEGMAVPNILGEFTISVKRPLTDETGKNECENALDRPIAKDLLQQYAAGAMGDRELAEKHMQSVKTEIEDETRKLYVLGDRCFGDDLDAFIRAMTDDEVEAKALVGALSKVEHPVIVDSGDSVNNLLGRFWSSHGKAALRALVPESVAEKHFTEDEDASASPLKVIRRAHKDAADEIASSNMPRYSGLSSHAAFTEQVVRAYKTRGAGGAVAVLDASTSTDPRTRSIAHAFYLALKVTTKSWKYTDEEKEFGQHLEPLAKTLLESGDADGHHEAFAAFIRAAGSTESLKRH